MKRIIWIVTVLVLLAATWWFVSSGSGAKFGVGVWVAEGFEIAVFAEAPDVTAPSTIATSLHGEVFVGEDEYNVRARESGTGRIRRFVDADGDGVPESSNLFADGLNGVRGLLHLGGVLYVVHPPLLSALVDADGDGVADDRRDLVTGFGHDSESLSPDHSVGGIRMGIDGWLYVHVGDQGIPGAVGLDGNRVRLHGGGIVRLRPDGSGLEIYATGIRNCYDVAVDPYLDLFCRENDNDGHGWTVRLHHIVMDGDHGYPGLYRAYPDEVETPLDDYGRGAGTGALYLHEPGLPDGFGDALYTGDWARGSIYVHRLAPDGASFRPDQVPLFKGRKPTDFDVDARGVLYVTEWGGHSFGRADEPHGRIYRIVPTGSGRSGRVPDLRTATVDELIEYLGGPSQVLRLGAQRELLERGDRSAFQVLVERAGEPGPRFARVAAMFTLAQLDAAAARGTLLALARDEEIGELAQRALLDVGPVDDADVRAAWMRGLDSANPRVRRQAVTALARAGGDDAAAALLPGLGDAEPAVRRAAVRGLRRLAAIEECLEALRHESADVVSGALRVLAGLHDGRVVRGLAAALDRTSGPTRAAAIDALARLYHREREWDGTWWGTRVDVPGPYFDPVRWEGSAAVAAALERLARSGPEAKRQVAAAMERHGIDPAAPDAAATAQVRVERRGTATPPPIGALRPLRAGETPVGELDYADVLRTIRQTEGNPSRGQVLFEQLACAACHAVDVDMRRSGPVLANAGDRYGRDELLESVLRPSKVIALGYDTWSITLEDDEVYRGVILQESGSEIRLADSIDTIVRIPKRLIRERRLQETSTMPAGLVDGLPVPELASLIAYLESL
jgi:putative membrane-bound dehydrogenase-like protein